MNGRSGNKGRLRLIQDTDSQGGLSAAILIQNVRPRRRKNGDWYVTHSCFTSNVKLNCDGVLLRPEVSVHISCKPTRAMKNQAKRQRETEAARVGSPILT